MNYNPPRAGQVTANGRNYRMPDVPRVVVCIDGSEPGYIERAIEQGLAPNFARLMAEGSNLTALSVIPSFTNPNNISIITGAPPAVHGIAGNYFYDPDTRQEVMMNDARFMRAPTIMQAFHEARRQSRDRRPRRTSCARCSATVWISRAAAPSPSRRSAPTRPRLPTTASPTCRRASACRCRTSTRRGCRSSSWRPASRCSGASGPT